jgi:hypothetical protein
LKLFSQPAGKAAEVHDLRAVITFQVVGKVLQVPHRLVTLAVADFDH